MSHRDTGADDGRGCRTHRQGGYCPDCCHYKGKKPDLVPLATVVEALADVLVDYDIPTNRMLREFRRTLTVYLEAA